MKHPHRTHVGGAGVIFVWAVQAINSGVIFVWAVQAINSCVLRISTINNVYSYSHGDVCYWFWNLLQTEPKKSDSAAESAAALDGVTELDIKEGIV